MSIPEDGPDGASLTRRAVLEGAGVAVLAGVLGFAWFDAAGPPSEEERERVEDEQDEDEDEDEDRDGPDRGSG